MYGVNIRRNGMACCIFHEDKTPSMKLNDDYFHCFGCGASGDVIDFAAQLFGISKYDAAQKLRADFGGNTVAAPVKAQVPAKHTYVRQFQEDEMLCLSVLTEYERILKKGYSTITSVRGVVKPAFQMAYNEDIIRKNPFDFKLVDVVTNDSQKRIAMTQEQQDIWMGFIREDKTYQKYYDEFVVLLNTGMRVSEFCGLTRSDIDFDNRKIRVDHQLVRERGGKYYVEKTKTECGIRFIPMTDEVYHSLQNIVANRRKPSAEMIIDGYSGFLLIDKDEH